MSQLGLQMTQGPGSQRSRLGSIFAVLVALLVVAGLLAGVLLVGFKLAKTGGIDDYPGPGSGQVNIRVVKDASTQQIAATLAANGVIKNAKTFVDLNDERVRQIQPGTYTMLKQMSSPGALDLLLDPTARQISRVVIPEGATVKKIEDLLATKGGLDPDELSAALGDVNSLGLPPYAGGNVEGFLFPATYDIDPAGTAADQIKAMVARWKQAASDEDLVTKAKAIKMTPYDVLIVASLLQAEVRPADFAKVARVIDNRLAKGMKLQLDTTVLYALGRTGTRLTPEDLATESPYNTYLNGGLPPSPIDNPGEAAIAAALAPAKGNWLYYITINDAGETKFTNSYNEFLKLKQGLKASS